MKKKRVGSGAKMPYYRFTVIYIERWKLVSYLVFQIIVLALLIQFYNKAVPGNTILSKVSNYAFLLKFAAVEDKIHFPFWLSGLRYICVYSCFLIGYILIHGIVFRHKRNRVLLIVNLLLGVLSTVMTGVQYYIIFVKSHNFDVTLISKWSLGMAFKALLLGVAIILTFQRALILVGRTSDRNYIDYMSNYIASPLMNLDLYVRENRFGCSITQWDTFRPLLNEVGRLFNIPGLEHGQALTYRSVNGFNLGNVYTMFFSFLYDGGVPAAAILLTIQAVFSQIFFQKAVYHPSRRAIDVNIIFYSYLFYLTVLGFFSERFYAGIFNIVMLEIVVVWRALSCFFSRVRFVHRM